MGSQVMCPGCNLSVAAPMSVVEESVLGLFCDCGESVSPDDRGCGACGARIPVDSDEGRSRRRAQTGRKRRETASRRAETSRRQGPEGGPISLPSGSEFSDALLVKFFCTCGKRVRLDRRRRDRERRCPRCDIVLNFPDMTSDSKITILCGCERPLVSGDRFCPDCGEAVFVESSPKESSQGAPVEDSAPKPGPSPPMKGASLEGVGDEGGGGGQAHKRTQRKIQKKAWDRSRLAIRTSLIGLFFLLGAFFVVSRILLHEEAGIPNDPTASISSVQEPNLEVSVIPIRPVVIPNEGSNRPKKPKTDLRTPSVRPKWEETKKAVTKKTETKKAEPKNTSELPPKPSVRPQEPPRPSVRDRRLKTLTGRVEIPAPAKGSGAKTPVPGKEPDREYFQKRVVPILTNLKCVRCHNTDPLIPTIQLRLSGKTSSVAIRKDFKAVLKFVDREDPVRSSFLLKPLFRAEGGVDHGGGDNFSTQWAIYQVLLGFVRGDVFENPRPLAKAGADRTLRVGEVAVLDAKGSRDASGKEVSGFQWKVSFAPFGSVAQLEQARSKETPFRPDLPGVYGIDLLVTDTKRQESHPDKIMLTVLPTKKPGNFRGSEQEFRQIIREIYLGLLSREPTSQEIRNAKGQEPSQIVQEILYTREGWLNWLENEFVHFRLPREYRLHSERVEEIAVALAGDQMVPLEAVGTILADPAFLRRYQGAGNQAKVLLKRLMGIRIEEDKVRDLRESALAMCAGEKVQIFGNIGTRREDLIKILIEQPECLELYLARVHERLRGRFPSEDEVRKWVDVLKENPKAIRRVVALWYRS